MEIRSEKDKGVNLKTLKEGFALLFRFNPFILRYWKQELLLLSTGGFSLLVGLATPYIGKVVLDSGILAKDLAVFIRYTVLAGILFVLSVAIGNYSGFIRIYVARKIRIDLLRDVLRKLRKLSLRFFREKSTGELIFRINSDVSSAANIITTTLPSILLAVLKLMAITVIIFRINWKIMLVVLAYQLLAFLKLKLFAKRTEELTRASVENSQRLFKVLGEVFSHTYFVKASGSLGRMLRRHFHNFSEGIRLEVAQFKIGYAQGIIFSLSNKLFFSSVSIIGGILVIKGKLTLGSLGAILAYLTQGINACEEIFGLARQIVMNRVSLERATMLLDAEVDLIEARGARVIPMACSAIEFRDVSFGYAADRPVVRNLTFSLPPKAKVALVGHSGCGKTTILNLLLRLYDADSGMITFAGEDIQNISFNSLYSQIAVVSQIPFLWNESLRYNVCFESPKAGQIEIEEAARLAEAHAFIEDFSEGYDTVVGEMGCLISRGQEQRIAIARALAKKPAILMLDEAFSSLDSETEDKIVKNIMAELKDSMVIVVSHRLSTVRKMEVVYFLKSASEIESGTHQQLLARCPAYGTLFASQLTSENQKTVVFSGGLND